MMMTSEDGQHGTHGHGCRVPAQSGPLGRAAVVADQNPIPGVDPAQRRAEAEQRERHLERDEPFYCDEEALRHNDATTLAYMEIHTDPYVVAYNAVAHRASVDFWIGAMHQLAEAMLGRKVDMSRLEREGDLPGLLHQVTIERARLLAQVDRFAETLAVQAESIASQQKLIEAQSKHAVRGKLADDALMLTAVKLGVNPVPRDAEECSAAIMAAFRAATQKGPSE